MAPPRADCRRHEAFLCTHLVLDLRRREVGHRHAVARHEEAPPPAAQRQPTAAPAAGGARPGCAARPTDSASCAARTRRGPCGSLPPSGRRGSRRKPLRLASCRRGRPISGTRTGGVCGSTSQAGRAGGGLGGSDGQLCREATAGCSGEGACAGARCTRPLFCGHRGAGNVRARWRCPQLRARSLKKTQRQARPVRHPHPERLPDPHAGDWGIGRVFGRSNQAIPIF